MFKKIVSLMCALVVTASMTAAVSSNAAVKPSDELTYVYARQHTTELTITGTTAKCQSTAKGDVGVVTRIDIVEQLQKNNSDGDWELVRCWSETKFSCKLTSKLKEESSLSHGRYRLKTLFTFYSGEKYDKYEKVTEYSDEKVV